MRRALHLALVPLLAFIVSCQDRQLQTDFWVHLARGRLIIERGSLLARDPFCFASEPGRLIDANWLSQVIFARLYAWGGLSLVQVVNAGIISLTFALLYRLCLGSSADSPQRPIGRWTIEPVNPLPTVAAAGACVIAFLGIWQTILVRPQTFSFLLFVLLYGVLCRAEARRRWVVTPVIMAIWCNLHGGFAIGLVLLFAFAGSETLQQLIDHFPAGRGRAPSTATDQRPTPVGFAGRWRFTITFLLGLLATLVNPFGWRIYTYALGVAGRASARHVQEWLPPSLVQMTGVALVLTVALAIVSMVVDYRRARRIDIRQLVLTICFVPLACRSVRMTPWWFLVASPAIARCLAGLPGLREEAEPAPRFRSQLAAGALGGALLLAGVMSLPWLERFNPLFGSLRSGHRQEDDLQAVAGFIGPTGRIYAPLEWGQYLDFALKPGRRLLVDGHIEAFSDPVWRDYCRITSGDAMWASAVRLHDIRYLLVDRACQKQLVAAVERSPQWQFCGSSGSAVVYLRQDADIDQQVHSPQREAALANAK